MKTLNATEVKNRINQNSNVYLVNTLSASAFQKAHIPNSLNINSMDTATELFGKNDEIIVYCSDVNCMASYYAYKQLELAGYTNIWQFAGGL
jgi:rhodanese-related sulfurtransferase